jgi:succinate dehydrogenase/fumarate reductase flavoprotein subunit
MCLNNYIYIRRLRMRLGGVDTNVSTDVLIIGGGMAGICAAIKAKEQGVDVTLVEKGSAGKTSGIQAFHGDIKVFDPKRGQKLEEWMRLINERSEYLNNREWSEIVVKDSLERYQELVSWGVEFYQSDGKLLARSMDGMENYVMVKRQFLPALRKKAEDVGVKILDRIMVVELLKQDGKVVGALGFHTTRGDLYIFQAKATLIATGGSALKLGQRSVNSWTADGEAMAYRAGAEISGKEFTVGMRMALRNKTNPSEGTWKEVDSLAHFPRFGYTLIAPMMPTVNAEGGPVVDVTWEAHCGRIPLYAYLEDLSPLHVDYIQHAYRVPGKMETDAEGLEILKGGKLKFNVPSYDDVVNVFGGAGIWPINTDCATGLPGLYAAGVSCATMASGVVYVGPGFGLAHGAVTGSRAGLGAARYSMNTHKTPIDELELKKLKGIMCSPMERKGGFSPRWITQLVQSLTIPYFILQIKHKERLQAALTLMEFVNSHLVPQIKAGDAHEWRMALEAKNMALDAEMRLRASLFRTESRGSHFREDYPQRDDPSWLAWVKVKEEHGQMKVFKEPVPQKWWPDLSEPYAKRYPRVFH